MRIFKWMAEVKRENERRRGLEDFYRVEYRREWELKQNWQTNHFGHILYKEETL